MKSKIRYVLSGFVVLCAFAGVYKILNNVPVKPDLWTSLETHLKRHHSSCHVIKARLL